MTASNATAAVRRARAPERASVRVGFMPLTDCAPLVMAAVLGFDERHGIRLQLSREASWSALRDRLCRGQIDAAHALYGLVTGVVTGIGAPPQRLAVLMGLGWNGQAITLARDLVERGITDASSLARWLRAQPRAAVFGHTFPTGDHALLLYYWLAAAGIDPLRDVQAITVPPPQMAASLAAGHMLGYCAGEPWNAHAARARTGFTVATSQQIWPDHPGKVLATTGAFADACPNTAQALIAAVLDAARWLDASDANRAAAAEVLAAPAYVGAPREDIAPRLLGQYEDGRGGHWAEAHRLTFHADGQANFPWRSDALWFLTQQRRWGLLRQEPNYEEVARGLIKDALYREAAQSAGVPVPALDLRRSQLFDGLAWDGQRPARYAAAFPIGRARSGRDALDDPPP